MSWAVVEDRPCYMAIGLPLNTSGLPLPSVGARSRTSTARPQSGTRCSRFAFICVAEIVHTAPAGRVDLVPRRQPDFTGTRRRKHQELSRYVSDCFYWCLR